MSRMLSMVQLALFRRKWRRMNAHNFTYANNVFPLDIVTCGNYSYGPLEVYVWLRDKEKLEVGNFVSIAGGVKFILGGNHRMKNMSNYHFASMLLEGKEESWTKGPVIVKDDVWIGVDSLILSGVTIGKGAVVGAGSVVIKDVPPYAVVAGNPAIVAKYRFEEDIIQLLEQVDYSKVNIRFIKDNIDLFYSTPSKNNIKRLIDVINDRVIK